MKLLEHVLQLLFMFLQRVAEDEEVVKVGIYEYAYCISKDCCHQPQESGWHVAISLLHNIALECPKDCREGGLMDILWFNVYLLVHVGQVNLQAVFCSSNIHPDLILIQEWSNILDHVVVPLTTIHDRMQFPQFFWDA